MQALRDGVDISVIVPVFNLEDYITPMLTCLKQQDLGDYTAEYIFVLNNCTDNSEQVIRDSGLPCTILECEEQGCGCARNVGFEASSGEYIWFMDGDDWLLSDTAIRDALGCIKAKGSEILRIPIESERFHGVNHVMVWQYVYKRTLIQGLRFRQIQPAEDNDFTDKVYAKLGYRSDQMMELPSIDRPLYFYNYLRIGSNMWRLIRGEDINAKPTRGEENVR